MTPSLGKEHHLLCISQHFCVNDITCHNERCYGEKLFKNITFYIFLNTVQSSSLSHNLTNIFYGSHLYLTTYYTLLFPKKYSYVKNATPACVLLTADEYCEFGNTTPGYTTLLCSALDCGTILYSSLIRVIIEDYFTLAN